MIRHHHILSLIFFLLSCLPLSAQQIKGTITDGETGETIPYASVVYKGHHVAVISDIDGVYSIGRHEGWAITFSAVGYKAQVINVNSKTSSKLDIVLQPDRQQLAEVTIRAPKGRYSRKNNPAVELMKKVIAAKKLTDLANHDYYKFDKYEKMTLAANDLTPSRLEKKPYSSTPWLLDQVELCKYNNKMILPISVEETVSETVYRKDPQSKKVIIKGQQSSGVNDMSS